MKMPNVFGGEYEVPDPQKQVPKPQDPPKPKPEPDEPEPEHKETALTGSEVYRIEVDTSNWIGVWGTNG